MTGEARIGALKRALYTDLRSTMENPSVESCEGGFLSDLSGAR
jgi:hypothetical protein